jgi:copper chaperone CopZ
MRLFVFTLLFLSSTISFGQSDKVKTAEIKTQIWCDHCNECESCGPRIYFGLKEHKGIKKIDVDAEANTITVKYDERKVTLDQIEEAIAMSGFDANDRKADPKAYDNLDACCKRP